jgi:hypothetical protein
MKKILAGFALLLSCVVNAAPFTVNHLIDTVPNPSINYQSSAAGSVARSYQSKLGDTVSVLDFGADPTGAVDSTAAIQSAITAASNIYIPTGTYSISGTISIVNGQYVHGDGEQKTIINENNMTVTAISLSGAIFPELSNLGINYIGTPGTNTAAIYSSAANSHIHDIKTYNSYNAIEVTSGSAQFFDAIQLTNYVNAGMFIHDVNDVYTSHFIFNAGNSTNGAIGGIRLANKAEAINFTDGDVLLGVHGMTTDAAANTIGNRPAYNRFLNVYFDSASNTEVSLNNTVETEFIGCWFSGGRSGTGFQGLNLLTTDSISFINSEFFNNGRDGAYVGAGSVRTTFIGDKFESNSVTAGNAVAHGLQFAQNATDFTVTNSIMHNGLYTGVQSYGLFLDTGTNNFTITNNDLTGNATGAMIDASGNVNKTISGNIGYALFTTNQNLLEMASITAAGTINGAQSVATNSTVGNSTLTAAQMVTGNIKRSGSTAAYTDTTDTAANIIASIPNAVTGVGYELTIANTVGFVDTIAAGTGVTLSGTTAIAASASRKYVVTITNVSTPAVTITGVSSGGL